MCVLILWWKGDLTNQVNLLFEPCLWRICTVHSNKWETMDKGNGWDVGMSSGKRRTRAENGKVNWMSANTCTHTRTHIHTTCSWDSLHSLALLCWKTWDIHCAIKLSGNSDEEWCTAQVSQISLRLISKVWLIELKLQIWLSLLSLPICFNKPGCCGATWFTSENRI